MDPVIELLKLASVGVLAGLFSSFISSRDHRQRKWWELRVAAYQGAIEAMSDLVYYYEKHIEAERRNRELSPDLRQKLSASWIDAYHRIRRHRDSGAFLFSESVNDAMQAFTGDIQDETYLGYLEANLVNAKRCLLALVESSKVDLRMKQSLLERTG